MRPSRQEQVARVEHLASLWERLFNLYLNEDEFEDISGSKENEFLALQGSIMEELAAVAEFEEGRLALVDEVSSVINEAVSLRNLKGQSDFQVRRRKERGRQVMDLMEKVRRFVAERDTTTSKQEKELEVRLSRPFWDPEKGKFGVILGRVVASPVRFFAAIRVAGEAKKANSFLLTLLSIVMIGCVITVVAFNASTARAISCNFLLESGILTKNESFVSKAVIWVFVVVGVLIVSLAAAIAAAIVAHVLALLLHVGFKVARAKGDALASHKVVAFGLTPLLLLIFLPLVGHIVEKSDVPALLLAALPAVVLFYVAVLQIIGAYKVHGTSVAAGIIGWLVGMVLFCAVVLFSLWMWHYAVGGLPPSSGRYVYVTAKETNMYSGREAIRTFAKGEILKFVEGKGDFYRIKYGKDEGRVRKRDVVLRDASVWSLPRFLVESSMARSEALIDRLSRKIEKQAR